MLKNFSYKSVVFNQMLGKFMKKIAVVSTVYPAPIDNGKKVILNGLVSYFIERFGAKNVHWVLVGGGVPIDVQNHFIGEVNLHQICGPSVLIKIRNVVLRSLLAGDKSIQESMFWSRGVRQDLTKCLNQIQPALVVYDTVRMGQLLPSDGPVCRNILYLDDLFSVRYERMLQQIEQGIFLGDSVLGNFAHFVPRLLHGWINTSSCLQRNLLKFERKRIMHSERSQPIRFNTSLLLNDGEVKTLAQDVKADVRVLRPWLPIEYGHERVFTGHPLFVFLGALNIPHNEIALMRFLKNGFEEFCKRVPEGELIIVGKNPTPRLSEEVSRWDGRVKLAGYVENLDDLLAQCCGMIVPLVFGSGVKLKVLEALARGVPLVSTDCGVEGIPVTHGKECYVENDLSQFGLWMERLMNLTENQTMSLAAAELFQHVYSQKPVFENYDSIFLPS